MDNLTGSNAMEQPYEIRSVTPTPMVRRVAGLLGLDPARLRLWLFARCVQESPDWPILAEVAQLVAPA